MGFFSRRKPAADTDGLGTSLIALRLDAGDLAPAQSTVVVFSPAGHARRTAPGKVACGQGETVFCFHPGPYTVDLTPFAAAPEWGLRLRFVVDAANPRVSQQRFDLYLYSETAGRLELAAFAGAAQMALQAELAQGALDLPPCTSLDEWHAFRAGLNQLMYTRYGVTVDDCVPVDFGEQVDYAAMLQTRARQAAEITQATVVAQATATGERTADTQAADAMRVAQSAAAVTEPAAVAGPGAPATANQAADARREPTLEAASEAGPSAMTPPRATAAGTAAGEAGLSGAASSPSPDQDARALRRLFLELPALSGGLRQLALPEGFEIFQQHQAILLRLNMAALNVNTMPSLAWAAPDQPLPAAVQSRRAAQTLIAQAALDEGWSLLARLQLAGPAQWAPLLDEADRICANLETGLSLRRAAHVPEDMRMEPSL
ncbi:hypothetical protein E4L98_23185 [Duganella callida]|uniref:Uncharacterized protein n=2 Tax=Duganella callida TaxID=2561932 RepID=A0A4Y9S501_9BURK|nr:hypothetical protein E4L98_23185 [Duganella callida]